MRAIAPVKKTTEKTTNNGFSQNFPVCIYCGVYARPAILMFGDAECNEDTFQQEQYSNWNKAAQELLQSKSHLKMVILEVGCGNKVPSVRYHTHNYLSSISNGQCTLVRINPDFPLSDDTNQEPNVISLMAQGLISIEKIDKYLKTLQKKTGSKKEKKGDSTNKQTSGIKEGPKESKEKQNELPK